MKNLPKSNQTAKLSKQDWIKAGFRALCNGGANAIKIEVIAREIGATKGSFYWHFKDLPALQEAMLDLWQDIGTSQVIDMAEEIPHPKYALLAIVRFSLAPPEVEFGGTLAEIAIRDWGRWNEMANARIIHVDKSRIDYIFELFRKIGFDAATAKQKANILYASYVGATHLRATGNEIKDGLLIAFARSLLT
ncbi:MAG: regulatory protein TetR [Hyphomonadaceae bacterium]|nr:MAG: regulatory protein TetR [Hyphomonadaceae bacterium]KAF0184962.1 MAG: regulatory protein TetR [Hyphomonadaceae bacterium]